MLRYDLKERLGKGSLTNLDYNQTLKRIPVSVKGWGLGKMCYGPVDETQQKRKNTLVL